MAELYTLYREDENGAHMPIGYAYGDEWVAQALMMNDMQYDTPEEAKAAWERWKKRMAEYIEREAALALAKDICVLTKWDAEYRHRSIDPLDVMELPAADVRPVVHGRWIGFPECLKYVNAYSDDHIVCSVCEECFSILDNDCERFNFCPNCGADMRETDGEEARRIKKQLALNELGYPYDLPKGE